MSNPPLEHVPLFPLSAHLMPGGRMQLRIFENRYIRMVREVCAGQSGFGICMYKRHDSQLSGEYIYPISTYATISDFSVSEDGLLTVTISGQFNFFLEGYHTEEDGLRVGNGRTLANWQGADMPSEIPTISAKLRELFADYPELEALYPEPQFSDPVWVIYRWMEYLPLSAEQKQHFLQQNDCSKVVRFLTQLLQ